MFIHSFVKLPVKSKDCDYIRCWKPIINALKLGNIEVGAQIYPEIG